MEYYGGILTVTVSELTRHDDGAAIMSRANYDVLLRRNRISLMRSGRGAGNYALIEYQSLPERYRQAFVDKYGKPEDIMTQEIESLPYDLEARDFFQRYRTSLGEAIPSKAQEQYVLNARVLNALASNLNTQTACRHKGNNSTPVSWTNIYALSERLRETYGHTLPKSNARLRDKMREYSRDGYACLVSGKLGNTSAQIITPEFGDIIVALRRSKAPIYTMQQLFDEANRRAVARGWRPMMSKSAMIKYLNRPEIRPRWYDAVYGELAAKQLFSRKLKTVLPSVRDSLWYGDGTKLNLFYKEYDSEGHLQIRTMQVYEVIDAATEAMLGYSISPTENFDAQYRAFRMAVETAGCKPYEIVTDNQGGQTTRKAQAFLSSICRVAHTTNPYNPQSKTIESVFGRFQREVLSRDWRYTGGNVSSKEGWKIDRDFMNVNKESLYTYQELVAAYAEARQIWNAMPHPSSGLPRMEMYSSLHNPEAEPLTALDMVELFWIRSDRAIRYTSSGITVQHANRRHTYEVLTEEGKPDYDFLSRHTGDSFVVRYDPAKMDCLLLYTETSLGLKYVATAYPYLTNHRAIQEQTAEERAYIIEALESNRQQRVRRSLENKQLEIDHDVAPEQHGLVTPPVRGISPRQYERIADTLMNPEPASEPDTVGTYNKQISNMDYDPMAALSRL